MAIHPEHELHTRRKGRNTALGLILGGFIALIFAVTIVTLSTPQSVNSNAPNFVSPAGANK